MFTFTWEDNVSFRTFESIKAGNREFKIIPVGYKMITRVKGEGRRGVQARHMAAFEHRISVDQADFLF